MWSLDSFENKVGSHDFVCCLCNAWAVLRWTVSLFISPCELILGVTAMNE